MDPEAVLTSFRESAGGKTTLDATGLFNLFVALGWDKKPKGAGKKKKAAAEEGAGSEAAAPSEEGGGEAPAAAEEGGAGEAEAPAAAEEGGAGEAEAPAAAEEGGAGEAEAPAAAAEEGGSGEAAAPGAAAAEEGGGADAAAAAAPPEGGEAAPPPAAAADEAPAEGEGGAAAAAEAAPPAPAPAPAAPEPSPPPPPPPGPPAASNAAKVWGALLPGAAPAGVRVDGAWLISTLALLKSGFGEGALRFAVKAADASGGGALTESELWRCVTRAASGPLDAPRRALLRAAWRKAEKFAKPEEEEAAAGGEGGEGGGEGEENAPPPAEKRPKTPKVEEEVKVLADSFIAAVAEDEVLAGVLLKDVPLPIEAPPEEAAPAEE